MTLTIPIQRWLQQHGSKLSSTPTHERNEAFRQICAAARDIKIEPVDRGPFGEQLFLMGSRHLINRDADSIRGTVISELNKPMPAKVVSRAANGYNGAGREPPKASKPVVPLPHGADRSKASKPTPPRETDCDKKPSPVAGTVDDQATIAAEIGRLAKLGTLEYERGRKEAADRLNIRASILDRLVAHEREKSGESGKQGRALDLVEPKPWDHAVDGAALLDELSAAVRRHVVMSDHVADAIALWIGHTYLLDQLNISPRLSITSPEKGCGKTTLLDVLAHLVWRPLETANVSASAVFRVVEKKRPTILMDEAETFIPEKEELRGILDSGHRRGGSVVRTVGDDFEPRSFSTYCASAIALIGKLPATLADRSIPIELQRRRPDEPITSFRFDRTKHLDDLGRKAARWAADNAESIPGADPPMPDGLFNRAADNWRVLLTIADLAGGEWPEKARIAAAKLAGATGANTVGTDLLADIKAVFDKTREEEILSRDLVESLTKDAESRWHEWKGGKPLTQRQLAGLLGKFKIVSEDVRPDGVHGKGYKKSRFEDAWSRYLDPPPPSEACKCASADEMGTSGTFRSVQEYAPARIENDNLSNNQVGLHACTDEKGGYDQSERD